MKQNLKKNKLETAFIIDFSDLEVLFLKCLFARVIHVDYFVNFIPGCYFHKRVFIFVLFIYLYSKRLWCKKINKMGLIGGEEGVYS